MEISKKRLYVGKEMIIDYLLFFLNKHKIFDYVKVLRLEKPAENIHELVYKVGEFSNYQFSSNT